MENVKFDYSRLKGKIVERYGTCKNFAEETNQSISSVTLKLNGKREMKTKEIFAWANYLGIQDAELSDYFFTPDVAK